VTFLIGLSIFWMSFIISKAVATIVRAISQIPELLNSLLFRRETSPAKIYRD
jgi:hypothetical protein